MLRVYVIVIILSILGGCAYAAKYYYDTTQSTMRKLWIFFVRRVCGGVACNRYEHTVAEDTPTQHSFFFV